ncbi:unnamed protein product, partial [Didymodactylos carnosus]
MEKTVRDEKYDEQLERVFAFCDKDKSEELDWKELKIGLFTILKLVDDTDKPPKFRLMLRVKNKNNIDDFKSALATILTQHYRQHYSTRHPSTMKKVTMSEDEFITKIHTTLTTKLTILARSELELIPVPAIGGLIILYVVIIAFLPLVVLLLTLGTFIFARATTFLYINILCGYRGYAQRFRLIAWCLYWLIAILAVVFIPSVIT